MAGPYRESGATTVDCPRCGRALPVTSDPIRACIAGCGVWVVAENAAEMFARDELEPSRLTTWFRERAACPHCSQQMTLCGYDMSLFMGCDQHGYWVDRETIGQTGLARGSAAVEVARARAAAEALEEELERAEREAHDQARARELAQWQRLEDEKRRMAETEAARAQEQLALAREREPYMDLVQAAVKRQDYVPLVDLLMRLDRTIDELTRRIAELDAATRH